MAKDAKKYLRSKARNEARRKERQAQHDARMELRSKRSPQAQLNELDCRLGYGVGAKKERTRLKAQIENASLK